MEQIGNNKAQDKVKIGVEDCDIKKLKAKQCGFEVRNHLEWEIDGEHAEEWPDLIMLIKFLQD